MALILSKIGITTGNTVETGHVTQSIDAFTGEKEYDIFLSGSLTLTGSLKVDGTVTGSFTGSLQGTASFATTASFVTTASYALNSPQIITLQFSHASTDAEGSDRYFGNFQLEPSPNIDRIAISSPIEGKIVSASIDLYTENPGPNSNPVSYKINKDVTTSPSNYSLSTNNDSVQNYTSFSEEISPAISVSVGTPINITMKSGTTEAGLNMSHNVTLVIQKQ
jgi:hypothetical protein